ncbi:hypothetical protein M501DRAFT_943629 [Patellaria atrata CBS 101060]|uniref:Cytochrome oxidase c assembly-domain-containing protein n=1 Tax=Patellaria atrata CBS 101060 TaxID=1346257 RepID=A0A9P4S3V1_9PEZI|nr:hypothetical protein M501DRAFT_943629 [Patellaria atrata CBS 101060]
MARSAMDATRFTATGPYASSKFNSPIRPPASSSVPGETPQQKVARLRENARRAKLAKESTFDRIVARGRVWADRAHRVTAITLIAATGVAGLVTVFALGDMMIYNRRKRKVWLEEQQVQHARDLAIAKQAMAEGRANDKQILLLNRERAFQESEEAKANKKGVFSGLFGGSEAAGAVKKIKGGGNVEERVDKGIERDEGVAVAKAVDEAEPSSQSVPIEEGRRDTEVRMLPQPAGGNLDRLGKNVATGVSKETKSWTSWIIGR